MILKNYFEIKISKLFFKIELIGFFCVTENQSIK